jgi:hypothetical protein
MNGKYKVHEDQLTSTHTTRKKITRNTPCGLRLSSIRLIRHWRGHAKKIRQEIDPAFVDSWLAAIV